MRNNKANYLAVLIMFVMSSLVVFVWSSNAQAQRSRAKVNADSAVPQQPLYTDYKGVRLGMTAQEVQTKFGNPAFKDKEMDYYVFSDTESAQFVYDASRKVRMITIDYANGTGAPLPGAVVGAELETKENGSLYKVVYYDHLGFWVSYSRTAGTVIIVTITIQKM
jgi:outer membrane protein assembly factor BamE (lipoprotein component of BamABCDE complex)